MKVLQKCWSWLMYAADWVSMNPVSHGGLQTPIGGGSVVDSAPGRIGPHRGPIFYPPHAPPGFVCDYTAMGRQWTSCSGPNSRDCWLTNGHDKFDIHTDYESAGPVGVTRKYHLDVASMTLAGDGFKMPYGKVFNQSYPGPWLQACWGDNIEVTVTNNLKYNGTSIHWHGIRQLNNNHADGVNAVTQCPIAGSPTNDSYTYKFKAEQYGTSWYHSHYALQYGDGLLGPLTIHGPSSSNWDDSIDPILMTDNLHTSAFPYYYNEIFPGAGPPAMTGILINGVGIYQCTEAELKSQTCTQKTDRYNVTVQAGKRYLLRIINTSVDTTFIFAVDNHNLTVIETDFVPIKPYTTDSVLVGIGQRYHVILDTTPLQDARPAGDRNYWIRTVPADGCSRFVGGKKPDNRTGILFYQGSDGKLPVTNITKFPTACSDEPYESLVPIVPWTVGPPANPQDYASTLEVALVTPPGNTVLPAPSIFTHWVLGNQSMWLNYSDPTILHYNDRSHQFPPNYVVVPQSTPAGSWIYLLISGTDVGPNNPGLNFVPVAHPIHLHGHDFAILSQSSTPYWPGISPGVKIDNPPRRDVALLPTGGHLIIAFRADNPGSWLMHCHIAWHSSNGLALQILERNGDILMNPADVAETERVCDNWNKWVGDKRNWWSATEFQDDSGI